jgi:hypothetical protein
MKPHVEGKIQVSERRERLEGIFNELIAINARDRAFLRLQEPKPIEVADWRMRRRRVAQLLQEFQSVVVNASWEA